MYDLMFRIAKRYAVKVFQLPVSMWIEIQWANLRFRETNHLLRLDDYLLKDMGLRKVDGRIEAIDPLRMDSSRVTGKQLIAGECRGKRARHAG